MVWECVGGMGEVRWSGRVSGVWEGFGGIGRFLMVWEGFGGMGISVIWEGFVGMGGFR